MVARAVELNPIVLDGFDPADLEELVGQIGVVQDGQIAGPVDAVLEHLQAAGPSATQRDGTGERDDALDDDLTGDDLIGDDRSEDEADLTAVEAMRRFWDREVAGGRVPTGAELSRAAGVPPATGLGRRKRREWEAELPEHLQTAAGVGR